MLGGTKTEALLRQQFKIQTVPKKLAFYNATERSGPGILMVGEQVNWVKTSRYNTNPKLLIR